MEAIDYDEVDFDFGETFAKSIIERIISEIEDDFLPKPVAEKWLWTAIKSFGDSAHKLLRSAKRAVGDSLTSLVSCWWINRDGGESTTPL